MESTDHLKKIESTRQFVINIFHEFKVHTFAVLAELDLFQRLELSIVADFLSKRFMTGRLKPKSLYYIVDGRGAAIFFDQTFFQDEMLIRCLSETMKLFYLDQNPPTVVISLFLDIVVEIIQDSHGIFCEEVQKELVERDWLVCFLSRYISFLLARFIPGESDTGYNASFAFLMYGTLKLPIIEYSKNASKQEEDDAISLSLKDICNLFSNHFSRNVKLFSLLD